MAILGISAGFHDAAVSVIDESGDILFAGHSERYSKIKNDPNIHPALLDECCKWEFDTVAFYERPWWHNLQQFVSGQRLYGPWTTSKTIAQRLGSWYHHLAKKEVSFSHHLSHAAAGFQTSPFNEAAVVVIDAIGELDTISIFHARYDGRGNAQYRRLWRQSYPHSIGLFYTAITQAAGLKPMEDEYITMGMAAYGDPANRIWMSKNLVDTFMPPRFPYNYHIGIDSKLLETRTPVELAAGAQSIVETMIMEVVEYAKTLSGSSNLVYMGGVALNCLANRRLGEVFDNIWIMPNPGDAGSSLGAAALAYKKKLNWQTAFLGYDIKGAYPVAALLDELRTNKIVGVANGRAEFGPRALGNRSLLADPRGPEIKDKVNEIKRRQKFRPFAPVILEEFVNDYFEMPVNWHNSPYMQTIAKVLRPDLYPAITHADGTARVQTVSKDGSGIRTLLEEWYKNTGCPMLLNTSLNIKGEPMVNDRSDAQRFEKLYQVKVL